MLGSDRSLINSLVRELPKGWQGEIRVLLLDPDSATLKNRAVELGHDPDSFATDCRSALRNVGAVARKYAVKIEARTYDREPILRSIIFDKAALVSFYVGKDGHIPIQYEIRKRPYSLWHLVDRIYDDLWHNHSRPVVPTDDPVAAADVVN